MSDTETKYTVQCFIYEPSYYEHSEKEWHTFKFKSRKEALLKVEELKKAYVYGIRMTTEKTQYFGDIK